MFEFWLRILDVGPSSFIGIAEGFPQILTHSTSVKQAEIDLTNSLVEQLKGLNDSEETRLELDDFPTVREIRIRLGIDSVF
jgi:hypothetical protein